MASAMRIRTGPFRSSSSALSFTWPAGVNRISFAIGTFIIRSLWEFLYGGRAAGGFNVGAQDRLGVPGLKNQAVSQPNTPVGDPANAFQMMANKENRGAIRAKLVDLGVALPLELEVANGKHFVHQKDIGANVHGYGEAEPSQHAARIGPNRSIDVRPQFAEIDYRLKSILDFGSG